MISYPQLPIMTGQHILQNMNISLTQAWLINMATKNKGLEEITEGQNESINVEDL